MGTLLHHSSEPQTEKGSNHQEVTRILWIILFLNLLVAAGKLVMGYLIRSLSMMADGAHSVGDAGSNVIGIVGVYIACRPPDEEHPYGHHKFETFATLPIAGLLLLAAWRVVAGVVERLQNPELMAEVTPLSLGVMVATLVVNGLVAWVERRKGEELSSEILKADAAHTLSDVWVSLSVLASLVVTRLGFPVVDTVVGGVVAVMISWTAIKIARRGANILADAAVLDPADVRQAVMQLPGVRETHDIRTRGRPDCIHVDLHVLVESSMSVEEGHKLSHDVEEVLRYRFAGIEEVIVHLEPEDETTRTEQHY